MTATSKAPRRPRIRPRGPPPAPTPIRTARGARTAAADERVLAEFLEASLRVPDLSLPPRKRFSFPPPAPEPDGIPSHTLVSGDADAEQRAIAAAAESGAFRVTGAVDAREARDAVEAASGLVFAAPEEVKRGLGRWFRRRDREPREEFIWFRPMSADEDRALDAAFPGSTYRAFREKVDTLASKMEVIAKAVIRVLHDNVKNPKASAEPREAAPSILRLALYSSDTSSTYWNELDSTTAPNSHALSVHLCGQDRRICLRSLGGSTVSTLPAGCMLVTVGKQIQEWSNGQFKAAVGGEVVLFETTDEAGPFVSAELIVCCYCPHDLRLSEAGRYASRRVDRATIVSFRDQILVALVLLSLFYLFRG